MTSCAWARASLPAAIVMSAANLAQAGVWYTDPSVGLTSDYSTNPQLLDAHRTAITDAAVLLDAPTTYTANAAKLVLEPSFRFSDNSGYSSIVSNYAHFTATGEIDTERSTLKATGALERDSSLYQDYNLNGSIGVRQDTAFTDATWQRSLTERLSFSVEGNYSKVRYGESNGIPTLTDYTYSSASPTLSWKSGERTTLSILGGFSIYDSLDGTTQSKDTNLELGFIRELGQLWTFTASAGYSRESNRIKEYFGPFYLGSFRATENGTVFSGNLTRQGIRNSTTVLASRTLAPSGFAFLSRRDLYQIVENYPLSERCSLQGYIRVRRELDPQFFAPAIERKYLDVGASAAWQMTELWTVSFSVAHVAERYGAASSSVAESQVSLELARRFKRWEWH